MDRGLWQPTLWDLKESDMTERLSTMTNGDVKEQVQTGQTPLKKFTTIRSLLKEFYKGKWAFVGGNCGFQTIYACRCVSVDVA